MLRWENLINREGNGLGLFLSFNAYPCVQQVAGADLLPVDHEDGKGRIEIGEMKDSTETCWAGTDDDDVEVERWHSVG